MHQIQIVPGGKWHRKSGNETACGEEIGGAFLSRDHELDADLCPLCFTKHERDTGDFQKIAKELQKDSDPAIYYDPDEEPTDPDGDVNDPDAPT